MYSEIADVYHEIFPLNTAFIKFIQPYLGPSGSKILDLGCGPGDYIHTFSEDYEGVGIDANAEMIRMAKSKNKGCFLQMPFEQVDQLDGSFSCIFCIGNSLSYLSKDHTKDFFQQIRRLLDPENGHFILQVVNWDRYKITGKMEFPIKTLSDGRTFHRNYSPNDEESIIFQTGIQRENEILGSWSDVLYPKTTSQLTTDAMDSGLNVLNIYGDFEKSLFQPQESPATVMVIGIITS